jgi:hypothetical protein
VQFGHRLFIYKDDANIDLGVELELIPYVNCQSLHSVEIYLDL